MLTMLLLRMLLLKIIILTVLMVILIMLMLITLKMLMLMANVKNNNAKRLHMLSERQAHFNISQKLSFLLLYLVSVI